VLHQILLERLTETAPNGGDDLVAQLRNLLPELVKQRHASPAHVAKLLGIGERTLGRRLGAAGTSYVRLREEAHHAVATHLLEGTRMPAQDIADQLGYAAPTSFSRAFRRWTGMGPAQWRASKHRPSRRNDQN
jgi:AraC-like DNA-binding protein